MIVVVNKAGDARTDGLGGIEGWGAEAERVVKVFSETKRDVKIMES
jgi:hypothetical protein